MGNSLQSLQNLGQSVWLDYIRRGMLTSGQFDDYLNMGITGVTSNPTIFEKAIVGSSDYDQDLLELARTGKSTEQIYEALAIEDIRGAADTTYGRHHLLRSQRDRGFTAHKTSLPRSP